VELSEAFLAGIRRGRRGNVLSFSRLRKPGSSSPTNKMWVGFKSKLDTGPINLGSLYVMPEMQGRGIGTKVLNMLLTRAAGESKAMTLAVVKRNPARHSYLKRGFQVTHEDEHKFYMRADPRPRQNN
jgi:GNAT superfamily N-acetyltransferase